MDRKIILAIDFNNMLFSSYYGATLVNSKGINVNAVKGFFFKLRSLKETFNPDYIIMANDLDRSKTFRRKLYPKYKAQRKDHDEDIHTQMMYASKISELLGYPFINNEEYEADDIIGMTTQLAADNDMDVVVISSDKDLYQLLKPNTFIYSSRNREVIDETWLLSNYHLTPQQWIDLKIIQGDRSDNIPGIYGIGEITALRLMQQYGSIQSIYDHMTHYKPRIQELLKAGEKDIELTRTLVTIITEYNRIGLNIDMIQNKDVDEDGITRLIDDLELYSLHDVMRYSLFQTPERRFLYE